MFAQNTFVFPFCLSLAHQHLFSRRPPLPQPMTTNAGGGGQRLGKSKDYSGSDGVMSSEEMVAMMNDGALLMSSSVNGTVMKTGANRDADGTIDRSPPPTEAVKVLLKELKRTTDRYGIDMVSEFRTQGASQYGTISKSRFNSIITTTFGVEKDHLWDDAKLNVLAHHYGTGADDLHLGGKMQVAWMDVCEDLGEIDASWDYVDYKAPKVGVSAIEMMLDAADGVIDGKVDNSINQHKSLMGDKRWA